MKVLSMLKLGEERGWDFVARLYLHKDLKVLVITPLGTIPFNSPLNMNTPR
jgi:hypothetical protein